MEKRELRKYFLARRAALTAEERIAADAAICRNIRELACYRESICVAAYASDGREPDLFGLFGEKRFFLPRYVAAKGCYELVEIHDFTRDLIPAKFGLREPRPELPAVSPEFASEELLYLAPAVACTATGVRLGRGGGFYDRMLVEARRPVVGVIYACQLAKDLPREEHDRNVDVVVTEQDIFQCKN
ncbi:MAG: 5-formyltetrahydrofolate cyclo-ligase [Lentisphaeria bacterium]|nr:MAG: 5-formyltetrahydrofolate cyclo-ligase [Lentisphaeria bacterium]